MNGTFFSRAYSQFSGHAPAIGWRLLLIVALALVVHVAVKLVRHITELAVQRRPGAKEPARFRQPNNRSSSR